MVINRKRTGIIILVITILASGWSGGEFNEEEFINNLKELHGNIYKAFDYSEDNEIYNCLAYSFMGEELEEQFFVFLRTIREFEAQGYRNYIQKIDYEKIIIEKRRKKYIKVYIKWRVFGLVKHLLHEHNRINTYEAIYKLKKCRVDKDWKVVRTQILSGERIIFPKRYYDPDGIQVDEKIVIEKVRQPL